MTNNNELNELDDFNAIEGAGTDMNSIDLSNIYNIKIGGFGDTNTLRTYFGSLQVKNLKEDISLYETLTKDKSWPVSQIIQREVDRIRVSGISKSYILGESRIIKYFPPIIVAILPKESDGKISLAMNFNKSTSARIKESIFEKSLYRINDKIKPYFLNAEDISLIEGLFLLEISKVFDMRVLAWDKKKYYAVVIDGQHRLESLFKSYDEKDDVGDYLQDVVFLDFSQLISSQRELTPVEIARRVFVDINTNAQRVGFVRQILMDDKDLTSLCVQSIVDSANKDGSSKSQDHYLRSQVVDWYGDKLKHTLPHITGILTLHQIINDYLIRDNIVSLNDRRSAKKVQSWVARIDSIFMVDNHIKNDPKYSDAGIQSLHDAFSIFQKQIVENEEYQDDIEDLYKETELFDFDYRILDVARDSFEAIYLRPLIKFFNEVKPYKRTIAIIESEGGFGSNETLSEALIASRNKIGINRSLRDAISLLKLKIEAELYDNYFLTFSVLGQKVMFNNLFQRIIADVDPDFSEEKCFNIIDNYLSDLENLFNFFESKEISLFGKKENVNITLIPTELVDLGTISSSFWDGIIYENNSIIYNTQGIRTLSFLLNEFIRLNKDRIAQREIIFNLKDAPYVSSRINGILKKRLNIVDEQIAYFANEIVNTKTEFIKEYFTMSD